MIKAYIRKLLNKVLWPLGVAINKRMPLRKSEMLDVLIKAGLQPKTVIDVGVHTEGTPELYEAYPNAKFILIEPNDEFEKDILKVCRNLKDFELVKAAASNQSGKGKLQIRRTSYVHTGLVDENSKDPQAGLDREIIEVDVITLDDLYKEKQLSGPCLVKVDVDGKDLEVLQGSVDLLKETDCVIVEAPLSFLTERGAFLEQQGFFLYAIVDHLFVQDVLWQVDLVYLNNKFKQDPRFRPWLAPGFRW